MMKMLHTSSNPSSVSSPHQHSQNLHNNHHHQQQQHHQNPMRQTTTIQEENLYSTPSMERKRMITRKEQEDLDKLLKDMIEELETFPEHSSTTYRTLQQPQHFQQQPSSINHINSSHNSRFQRNTSRTRSFSHSPSIRSPAAIVSYNNTIGQSCSSTPITEDVTDSHHNFNQSHHPLSSQLITSTSSSPFPQQSQQRQQVTQAIVHNHSSHHPHQSNNHNQAPSTITSVSSFPGSTATMKGGGSGGGSSGGGLTSAGQPYCNIYGSKSIPGQSEYTYGQVKPPPPLQLKYQPANPSSLFHHHHSSSPTYGSVMGHNDEHDYIGYTRSTACSGHSPHIQNYSTIQKQQQQTIPVMPVAPPYITKQHDIPSYSPAPSRSSAKSITLTSVPKPVQSLVSSTTPRSPSPDRNLLLHTTRVIPGAKIDLEDHDRSGVYASVLGKKSLSRSEREELDELVNVMMEEVRNFPDYPNTPGTMSKRGTPFRRSVSHGSGHQPGSSRMSRMESRSPTRSSFNAGSSLNRFSDRSKSWNRGMLRDSQSPGRCSRVLEQGSHGHGHSHGPGGQCGIANGGIVKPVSPLPPHLLTRPTQWIEDEVSGGHRDKMLVTPYHARADSRPFTYGVTPATAYPVLQQRRQNTESTAYIVENNPTPEQFTTFRAAPSSPRSGGPPPGDGSAARASHFTSGPNFPVVQNRANSGQDPSAIYSTPRGDGNHHHLSHQHHQLQQQQYQQQHHQPLSLNQSQQEQNRSTSSNSNDPRHEQQLQQQQRLKLQQSSSSSSLPKITFTSGRTVGTAEERNGGEDEIEQDGEVVFPSSSAPSKSVASYSKSIDSGLNDGGSSSHHDVSWLQRQQNKLKVRRSSLDSHDRKVREDMFSELVGTVSGRKVRAIDDSSRESSPPNNQYNNNNQQRPKSPTSPKRVRSPGLKVSFDSPKISE